MPMLQCPLLCVLKVNSLCTRSRQETVNSIFRLFTDSIKAYLNDRAAIYGAGLAYYAVFAIAPLIVFVVWFAGLLIGRSEAINQLLEQVQYFVGPQLAGFLVELTQTVSDRTFTAGTLALSVAGLFMSAAGIFGQLDTALNDLWGIHTLRPQTMGERLVLLRRKLGPFVMVFFLGLLLSVSVIVDTGLTAISSSLARILPVVGSLEPHINSLVIPLLTFLTFSAAYKWLPDAHSRWRDMAVGAFVTTILFLAGRWGLTLYLGRSDPASLYGAAASIIILLIWVNVSAHIVLFGAEFTKLYADRFGQPIVPRRLAAFVDLPAVVASAAGKPDTEDDPAA